MKPRFATLATLATLATTAAIALLSAAGCGGTGEQPAGAAPAPATAEASLPAQPPEETFSATLLFADDEGRLKEEKRDLPAAGESVDRARRVVEALLDGPHNSLTAVLPVDATLRAFYMSDDGTAYVDFDAGFTRGLAEGSEDVLLAANSLVGTLAANFSEVRQVRILVEGGEVPDFGGHLDLSRPIPVGAPAR